MDTNIETHARLEKLEGIGCSRKRREDPRFIQGKGNYVDDIKLPGMLSGVMVRSPYAHAKIVSIDTSKAKAHPGVHAVLTAEDLKPLKLHWMPTLAGDVQAVLADGRVSFQNQEVAFVVADTRHHEHIWRDTVPGNTTIIFLTGRSAIRTRPTAPSRMPR